jgi:hypothetical protein
MRDYEPGADVRGGIIEIEIEIGIAIGIEEIWGLDTCLPTGR